MSILSKEDRSDLVWAMRSTLLESVKSSVVTEGKKAAAKDFIINEATYQQLLNLSFNPERETNYKSTEELEKVALESYKKVLEASVVQENYIKQKWNCDKAVARKFGVAKTALHWTKEMKDYYRKCMA